MTNYNGKSFRPISNSGNGETSNETIFHYKQIGNILTSEYSGGKIKCGHLMGLVDKNGKIMLHESWEWTSGDKSKGQSVLEEL